MSFQISDSLSHETAFITSKSSMSNRWDPFYHRPSIAELESKVAQCTSRTLRDYANNIAGGATPSTRNSADNYTDAEDGVPFIRVQNLSVTGKLDLEDVKYITRDVHENDLQRSQLDGGELLVQITGIVDRIVASVVPEGFEANINQHMVAIETGDKRLSEQLAAWLNLDLIGKLAVRRTTGMSRPALDYDALKSIPALADEYIRKRIENAVQEHREKKENARKLLANTDEVLLDRLGIELPEETTDTIEHRMFVRPFSQMTAGRFDASSNWRQLDLNGGKYPVRPFSEVVAINPSVSLGHLSEEEEVTFVPMEGVSDRYGEIKDASETRPVAESDGYTYFAEKDILWAKITPSMENGKSAVASNLVNEVGFGSTEFHVFRPRESALNVDFLHALLRLEVLREHAALCFSGAAGHQRVDTAFFEKLKIPVPPIEDQRSIARELDGMRRRAKTMVSKASQQLEEAKAEVETLILNGEL